LPPLIYILKEYIFLERLTWMQSHTLLSNIKKISIKFRLVVLENALMGIPWYSPVKLTIIAIKIWNKPPNSD